MDNDIITFVITYFAKKHNKTITRNGDTREGSRTWTDKLGQKIFTYWDLDVNGYRTARDSWTVSYV